MHPSFSRPLVKPRDAFHSDITSVEHRPGFSEIRHRLLSRSSGSEVLRYHTWDQRGFNLTVSGPIGRRRVGLSCAVGGMFALVIHG